MDELEKDTLRRLMTQFPSLPWEEAQLDELVAPRHGIISGFADLLRSQAALRDIDLGEQAPAGSLQVPQSQRNGDGDGDGDGDD